MIQPSRLQEIMPGARFGSAYPSHHQFLHYADTTAFSAPVIGIPVTKAQEFQFFRQDNNSLSWLFNEGAYEGLKSEDNSFLEDSEKSFYGNGGVLNNPRDLTLDVGSSPAHSPDSSGQSIPEDLAVDKIDSINSNLSFSSSSTLTESSTGTAKEMVHNALTAPMESKETRIDREILLMRYREKKKRRKFQKQIRYESRKAYADKRPRIKGRFVKRLDSDDHCPASVSQSNSTRFDLHWVYS